MATPKTFHEFVRLNLELGCVNFSKLFQGEGPTMETGSKSNSTNTGIDLWKKKLKMTLAKKQHSTSIVIHYCYTLLNIHHDVSHWPSLIAVRSNDHVD